MRLPRVAEPQSHLHSDQVDEERRLEECMRSAVVQSDVRFAACRISMGFRITASLAARALAYQAEVRDSPAGRPADSA